MASLRARLVPVFAMIYLTAGSLPCWGCSYTVLGAWLRPEETRATDVRTIEKHWLCGCELVVQSKRSYPSKQKYHSTVQHPNLKEARDCIQ